MREMIGHVDFKVCFHQFYSHMAYRHASPPLPSVNVVLAVYDVFRVLSLN